MAIKEILEHIDAEIARLQQARALLANGDATPVAKSGRGRPKGSKNRLTADAPAAVKTQSKRKLSPEGRKAIADAMKRRWAERRKQTTKA